MKLWKKSICLLLAMIMLLGMIPGGLVSAAETTDEAQSVVVDFKAFAKEAAKQDWWDALGATDDNTRFIGKADKDTPMTDDQIQAYADMREYLAQNGVWTIDETLSGFEGDFKRAYFNTAEDMPWGLNFYTYYHANGTVSDKGKFAMTVTAPAAGWYRLEMDAYRTSEYYNGAKAICHNQGGGGGHVNVYVNDELVHEDYSFSTRNYSNTARYYGSVDNLGAVYLEAGENSVILDSIYAFNGATTVVGGRCNIMLNAMTFEPLDGFTVDEDNEYFYDLTTSWLAFTDDIAAFTVASSDEDVLRASVEDGKLVITALEAGEADVTVYDGETELCSIPVTVEALINEAKTPIVIDFKAFAKAASAQDWWDDLAKTDDNTRYIGRYGNAVAPTDAEKAAYAEMQAYLAENENWTIDEDLSNFTNWWKRAYFNASPNVPWGMSYWCYYHSGSTVPDRAKLALTVTAEESGWYSMELDAFRSNLYYSTESMTHFGSGGGHVDVYVNGQKVYDDYSLSGRDYANTAYYYGAVNNIGKVWLNEGENSVYLDSIHAFDSATTVVGGRCNINLNSITFEPLNVQTLKAGASRVLDLRASYLGYQDEFSGEAVSSDEDVVQVTLDGTVLTMTAGEAGEAEIEVGDITIPVVVEKSYGESYDFSDKSSQLTGDSASKDFTVEVSEDGWYEPVIYFTRNNAGGKVAVYMDGRYLGTVNTYDSDDKIAAFDRLGPVELTAGEHILRITMAGKDNGMGGNTPKLQWHALELLPTEEPTIRLNAKGIVEKRLRPAETALVVSGMANSTVDAEWELEVSDETVLEAEIVPATLTTEAKLCVRGLQASEDAWVKVTVMIGGVCDVVTVPVTVLPTSGLVSMDVSVKGVETGVVARSTIQSFAFDMLGDDGEAMTPDEVEVSYAVSEPGIIEIDEDTHTFETLVNGEVTVTITVRQNETVFTKDICLTVDDRGENKLAADASSFDDDSKWNCEVAPSDTQWLSSQIVDDGTGNMALKLEHNPNATQSQSVNPAYVSENGHLATLELGHLYEMRFRFKYEGYKRAEGALYDPRLAVQIYDYYGNGFGVGGTVNKLYTGIILQFFRYEEGQWHDLVIYARGPAEGEGTVYGMPRITYNCHYGSPADKELTGWEGTFWFDDIEIREVGFETMEVVAEDELRADKMTTTVNAKPVSTTGNYITLDKGTLKKSIVFESDNTDVVEVISEPTVIEEKPTGLDLTREAATAKIQLVGKNDTGSVLATATVGKVTRTGALEITATNMPEAIRDINLTLNGVESLVLPHGGTAESDVTGRTTELMPLTWDDFDSVYFTSSDLTVATVEPYTGKVTCVGEGTATITAYALLGSKSVKGTALITVTDDTDLASIEIDTTSAQVAEGNLLHFSVAGKKASGVKADMAKYPVAWSVDDDTVATITAEGILNAIKTGTVTVKASIGVEDAVIEDTMVITVADNEDQPRKVVEFKFYNEGAPKMQTATLEKDGIEIDFDRTYKGLEGNEWHKGGFKFPVPVGGELYLNFMIERSGWYRVETRGFCLYYLGCLTSYYIDDTYIGSPDFGGDFASNYDGGGVFNTVWLDAGVHTMRYKAEEARSILAGKVKFYPVDDPNEVSLTATVAKDVLVAGETTALELDMMDANQHPWFLHYETDKPEYTNYYTAVSSDPSVVSITRDLFTTYLNAHKEGEVTITVTAEILGKTVVREIPVTVESGTIISAELDAEFTTHRPGADPFLLTLNAQGVDGELATLPEGTAVTYTSADSEIAEVSADGYVLPGTKEGSTLITAVLNENGHKVVAELWITITSGKSEPTIFTYEERANAQENVLKYNWAWQEKEAAVKLADYYVENLDKLYEAFVHEGIPKSPRLTLLKDDNYAICPGCGTDLVAAGYVAAFPYLVDPIENPWKVRCPHCKMDFPSNDFESFYKCGLDERGRFTIDRAMANGGEKYLVNELYPERGEGWGVDNGFGWFPGEYLVDGNERGYLFISYYVTFCLYTVSEHTGPHGATSVFNALREAYIFTGDEKYGNAGAILIDRYADIYPGHDLTNWSSHRTWYSGNAGNFGKVTDLTWESLLIQCLAKAVDAFWPCADNPEVVEYLRGKASLKGLEPEDITPEQIRQNAENGILREAIKSYYSGKAWGNFGLPQAGAALTAVCLDSNPETEELINWIFKTSLRSGTANNGSNTGADANRILVEEVCRDGFGNEGSMSYNHIWLTNLLECADALNGYDKVESADLWEHPKVRNMYRAFMKVTNVGRLCIDVHETPGAFQALTALGTPEVLMPAFVATGDPEIAQAIYSRNGNSVEGLHADIYTKDPESGLRTRIQQIVNEYGQWDMSRSEMLSGYGMSILRRGPETYIEGANEEQFFDFWMDYGKTDSHTHFEALNMELSAFGLPLNGNMGYPQVMSGDSYNRLQWIQNTVSNNTVVVDDSCQVSNSESGFPLHFEDAGKVKIMDADAPASYAQTDIYRRTVVTVQGDNGIDYGVDFFRILGGSEHVYSFHGATRIDPTTVGLEMVKQPMGTYEGADVPFGDYIYNKEAGAAINTGSGYNWLWDVYRDETPGTKFTVDWAIEDYQHQLATSAGIHMRLTMLSEEPLAEVALANGQPAQDGRAPDHVEFMLVRNSGGEGLDTLFTSIIEPYQHEMQVIDAELVEMEPIEGDAILNERYIAVKTTLNTGRVDYIVYTTNPERTYSIDNGKFTFKGFAGVASYRDDMLVYSYGCEATSLCDSKLGETLGGALDAVTGTILNFTGELSENYTMTVSVNEAYPAEELAGRYIYVNNDRHQNGAYEILGAARNADGTVTLDMGHQDFIRGYVDAFNMDLGYIYNIAEGQTFSIPLSADFDAMEFFNYQTDTVVKAGNKLSLTTGISGMGVTFRAEGLPTGAKFNSANGTVTWVTSKTQVGRYPVTIEAVDAEETVLATMSFTIYVVNYTGSAYAADVCSHAKAVTYEVDGVIETVCPACGTITKTAVEEEPETRKFDLVGSNMTLGNELKLNFMANTADLQDGYYAVITHNGETTEATFATYNSRYSSVTYTVAAAQMADTVSVEVFDADGNAVSNLYETSVRAYAMNMLGRGLGAKINTLLVDMLNYGAAAQNAFAYNTSDLANSKLTEEQKALATEAVACTDGRVKGDNYYGSNISLQSKILLNVFFKNVTEEMYAEITFTDFDGTEQTVEVPFEEFKAYSGSVYGVVVDDIALAESFTLVTVTVYNADGSVHGTATDSVESYIARSAKSDLNEAIMKFAASAKAYYS